ncbi:hypothetical protein G3I76_22555, partial [Streptomyces sp. SID11233]|nr:hypothetical protein [Streptomyces sp. SID11233]
RGRGLREEAPEPAEGFAEVSAGVSPGGFVEKEGGADEDGEADEREADGDEDAGLPAGFRSVFPSGVAAPGSPEPSAASSGASGGISVVPSAAV